MVNNKLVDDLMENGRNIGRLMGENKNSDTLFRKCPWSYLLWFKLSRSPAPGAEIRCAPIQDREVVIRVLKALEKFSEDENSWMYSRTNKEYLGLGLLEMMLLEI